MVILVMEGVLIKINRKNLNIAIAVMILFLVVVVLIFLTSKNERKESTLQNETLIYEIISEEESEEGECATIKVTVRIDDSMTDEQRGLIGDKLSEEYTDRGYESIKILMESMSNSNDEKKKGFREIGSSDCGTFREEYLYPLL